MVAKTTDFEKIVLMLKEANIKADVRLNINEDSEIFIPNHFVSTDTGVNMIFLDDGSLYSIYACDPDEEE